MPVRPVTALTDVEVILVNYRSSELIKGLLLGWPTELSVAIVDNSCNVDGVRRLAQEFSNLRYLQGGGQGYARAANRGAFSSRKEFLFFVNPDSRPTIEDLTWLLDGLVSDPYASSHAPVTTSRRGDIEIGVGGWEPTLTRTTVHALGLHKVWRRAGLFAQPKRGERQPVDWTTGDCMVVRTAQFRELGGFDETFFLYMEDVSLGRRARAAGLHPTLRADVVIAHVAESSGAPMPEMLRLRGAAFAHYALLNNSASRANAMRAIMAFGYSLRAVTRLLSNRRSEARLFLAYTQGVVTRRATVNGLEVARARYEAAKPTAREAGRTSQERQP